MLSYKQDTCNIPSCNEPVHEHHMCQKHYEFYSSNPLTAKLIAQEEALENGTAKWKLKFKVFFQGVIHYTWDIPVPLIHHFPLEHVFLGEYFSLRAKKEVDSERVVRVLADFDIPENENIADMRRILNIRDIETSELGPKEKYLLGNRDLPSKLPILISAIGFILLFCFFEWLPVSNFRIMEMDLNQAEFVFWKYIPFLCALVIFIFLGLLIPSKYNYFVDRSYNLTLYKDVYANVDLVNQISFVKEKRSRFGSYYASILGSTLGLMTVLFGGLLYCCSSVTWVSVLFCLAVALALAPLTYSYCEMVLYFPVVEALTRKWISIDLYNSDHRGGLKIFHKFLYLVFLYNEGVVVISITIFMLLPISKWWIIPILFILRFRFNNAGWAVVAWLHSIVDFNRTKRAEQIRLSSLEGSVENMHKKEMLGKTHSIGLISLVVRLVLLVLIPYLVNQMPKWSELLKWMTM